MAEYIEKEAAINELMNDALGQVVYSREDAADCIRYMDAAEVVPVQEWISVKDRLPDAGGYVVCIAKRNPFSIFMPMVARIEKNGWVNPITEQYISYVTHWMPLPPAPEDMK